MTYLGASFDTIDMCMQVESDKIVELKNVLVKWARKTVAKKHELRSILGKLIWVSKTVRHSRVFVSRIISELRKLPSQSSRQHLVDKS